MQLRMHFFFFEVNRLNSSYADISQKIEKKRKTRMYLTCYIEDGCNTEQVRFD